MWKVACRDYSSAAQSGRGANERHNNDRKEAVGTLLTKLNPKFDEFLGAEFDEKYLQDFVL